MAAKWLALALLAGLGPVPHIADVSEDQGLYGAALFPNKLARETNSAHSKKPEPNQGSAEGNEHVALSDIGNSLTQLIAKVAEGRDMVTDATNDALAAILDEMTTVKNGAKVIFQENQLEVNRARDVLISCNNATDELHTKAEGIDALAEAAMSARSTHAACRTEESRRALDRRSKCNDLMNYKANLKFPGCVRTLASRLSGFQEGDLACVKEMAAWSATANSTWVLRKALCNNATVLHTATKDTCDRDQIAFELATCDHFGALLTACDEHSICWSSAEKAFGETVRAVQVAEAATKAEYVSAERITCYVAVLNATADEQSELLTRCANLNVNTDHLTIAYPQLPSSRTCAPVAAKPCEATWLAAEYEGAAWYGDAPPTKCTACAIGEASITTTAPITPMTTVAPMATMVPMVTVVPATTMAPMTTMEPATTTEST